MFPLCKIKAEIVYLRLPPRSFKHLCCGACTLGCYIMMVWQMVSDSFYQVFVVKTPCVLVLFEKKKKTP